ncbi:hypothetical protein [Emticicia sp. C21]|uniref:hypothetical protein n=1 Tax=Emticicia sp. C21 TaxID=2302915 RepID=UPI000E3510EA|nr:hypothetical protein [Emticicia sp. C21]RFS17386.1 hypothetical protein D0T08_06295 [Emticicia sp. C21]
MTKEQVDDLVKRAQPFLGKPILIREGKSTPKEYLFKDTGNRVAVSEDGELKKYSIKARLVSTSNEVIFEPLTKIVEHFEANLKD